MGSRVPGFIRKWLLRGDGGGSAVSGVRQGNASNYYSRMANVKCKQCLDTGTIVRGHDGMKISCPNCR